MAMAFTLGNSNDGQEIDSQNFLSLNNKIQSSTMKHCTEGVHLTNVCKIDDQMQGLRCDVLLICCPYFTPPFVRHWAREMSI